MFIHQTRGSTNVSWVSSSPDVAHGLIAMFLTRFAQADIRPFAENVLVSLLKLIESGETPEKIAQNDYLMKCTSFLAAPVKWRALNVVVPGVMRVIITARQALTPVFGTILQHLVAILAEVSKNPSNPKFNHFAFESISALIRCASSVDC